MMSKLNTACMHTAVTTTAFLACTSSAFGFDPQNGDWLKGANEVRVMTWNIEDGICSSNTKQEGRNNWNAIVRVIAAMEPDIIILQEAGDNSGNGTGGGVDSVSRLTTTFELMIFGGTDIYNGNVPVGSYIQKYEPHLDYNIFVSGATDGFNRNVILSRFPFMDLNMDASQVSQYSNINVREDEYAPGNNGGIRGYQFAEINLPDEIYGGDLVIGNGHLKSGFSSSDINDRRTAAQNIAYFIDYFYNGAGTGQPDPNNKISFDRPETVILDELTPVIWGGDLNQTPSTSQNKGPVEWMTRADDGASDGTDRDRSDSTRDTATDPLDGSSGTLNSSKLDYIIYQDSIATLSRNFIFDTAGRPNSSPSFPPEVQTFDTNPRIIMNIAADHLPVIADFILPGPVVVQPTCPGDVNSDGFTDISDLLTLLSQFNSATSIGDLNGDVFVDISDLLILLADYDCDESQL